MHYIIQVTFATGLTQIGTHTHTYMAGRLRICKKSEWRVCFFFACTTSTNTFMRLWWWALIVPKVASNWLSKKICLQKKWWWFSGCTLLLYSHCSYEQWVLDSAHTAGECVKISINDTSSNDCDLGHSCRLHLTGPGQCTGRGCGTWGFSIVAN